MRPVHEAAIPFLKNRRLAFDDFSLIRQLKKAPERPPQLCDTRFISLFIGRLLSNHQHTYFIYVFWDPSPGGARSSGGSALHLAP